MATTSLNISLPEALKEFVHERVAEKAYSNPSDYVRALIREDQRRRAEEKLEQLLLEGLESGPPQPVTPEDCRPSAARCKERLSESPRQDDEPARRSATARHVGISSNRRSISAGTTRGPPQRFQDAVEEASRCCRPCRSLAHPAPFGRLKGLRMWQVRGFEKHLIFYRPIKDGIEVIRVLHASRDLVAVLDEDSDE